MDTIVMKFGGTSVQDVEAFQRVSRIVHEKGGKSPVVVTSAMAKVTDALLDSFELAKKGNPENAFSSLDLHFSRHLKVAEALLDINRQKIFQDELDLVRREIKDLLSRVARRSLPLSILKDAIVSYGELMSSRLL
ncbi:MAG: hypothetical protein D6735_12835, partial [Acidobacteria bacterium]